MSAKELLRLINKKYQLTNENLEHSYNCTVYELIETIKSYVKEADDKYNKNKQEHRLTFGKYKGFTIEEMSRNERTRNYLSWLLSNNWMTEDKFPYIYSECEKFNIKKNSHRKPPLDWK